MYQTVNGTAEDKFTAHVSPESVTIFCSIGLRLRFRSVCVCKGALTWRSHSRAHALPPVCISSYIAELWADLLRTGSVVRGFVSFPFSSTICMGYCKISLFWRDRPQWDRASSFTRLLDHTKQHATVARTPLGEWSARSTDLYLTTHNTHNRQTSMPLVGIRTRNLSRRAAADLRLRRRGHWDRLILA